MTNREISTAKQAHGRAATTPRRTPVLGRHHELLGEYFQKLSLPENYGLFSKVGPGSQPNTDAHSSGGRSRGGRTWMTQPPS